MLSQGFRVFHRPSCETHAAVLFRTTWRGMSPDSAKCTWCGSPARSTGASRPAARHRGRDPLRGRAWCAKGWLQRRHRGVYLVGPLASPHTAAMAALLAVGPHAALSHRTAAVLHELLPPRPGRSTSLVARAQTRARARHPHPHHRATSLRAPFEPATACASPHPSGRCATSPPTSATRATEQAHVLGLVRDPAGDAAFTRSEAERRMLALIRAAGLPAPRVNTRRRRRTRSTCAGRLSA